MKRTDLYSGQAIADTLDALGVDGHQGLNTREATSRLEKVGYNEIEEKEEPVWRRIVRRFWGPIPWMIEVAGILSAVVRKWEDFLIILIMLLVNVFLDFFQEHRALNALKALKQGLANESIVLRDGVFHNLPVRELVPGDIIKLRIGDVVPADVQLIEGDYLLLDESALTGESLPVGKQETDVAFANTIVKQGEMLAVVVNTATATNFHSVVALVAQAERTETSHFQKMVIRIGNFLIVITIVLVALILMVALSRHENFLEIVRFSLVLTVAAIPVALPAVLSVTMAVGALNLARKQAIVSRLVAIEELAGVDVFCSDKTGTLTKNEMQVADPVLYSGIDEYELYRVAALASRFENHDPIELPILQHIEKNYPEMDWQSYRRIKFIPFDPVSKRTEAAVEKGGIQFTAIKGAPQVVFEMAALTEEKEQELYSTVDQLAAKGYRTIAVARKTDGEVQLLGLIPLFDPPREDSKQVIDDMRANGVAVKMVTGDNIAIAREVGSMLGLEGRAIRASELKSGGTEESIALAKILSGAIFRKLKGEEIDASEVEHFTRAVTDEVRKAYDVQKLGPGLIQAHESEILEMIESVDIFAEVVPEDKYRIVDTLQKADHIVAMTGDGVNDAPALKKADCGFSVSNATDAARAAADIILTAPGLSVINDAVRQARITFERMKSYATFRIAETIRIVLFMAASILIFNFYPITALMIIILALLNDLPILAIAYDNTRVRAHPVRWKMFELLSSASALGVSGVVSSFALFFILLELNYSHEIIQSFIFLKLIVAGHSTLYITRTESWFWKRPWPSPILFGATFLTEVVGTVIAAEGILIPAIGWTAALYVWCYALAWMLINDGVKLLTRRLLDKRVQYA